ncbi:tRNA-dihydrouridine synthase C [bacterium BMS3Abin01]|nr:tRNA-dihydrouridine synthase C [bacterium BMS3Abin01]
MAGISVRSFRLQARRYGAGMVATEMISSYAVHYRNQRTLRMLELAEEEHPVSVQLFGNRPEVMAEAALAAEGAGADIIDINMGCPVRKVIKTGAGMALMEDGKRAAAVVAAIVDAVRVPVTAKIRSGPGREVTALSLASRLEDAGLAGVCIHPRLGVQGRKGRADHTVTAALVERLRVPVIASGDIAGRVDAERLLQGAGAAAVMPGRAMLGDPWLFTDMLAGRERRRRRPEEVMAEMRRFFQDLVVEMGRERAVRFMRKFYGWYMKPFRLPSNLAGELRRAQSYDEAESLMESGLPGISPVS